MKGAGKVFVQAAQLMDAAQIACDAYLTAGARQAGRADIPGAWRGVVGVHPG